VTNCDALTSWITEAADNGVGCALHYAMIELTSRTEESEALLVSTNSSGSRHLGGLTAVARSIRSLFLFLEILSLSKPSCMPLAALQVSFSILFHLVPPSPCVFSSFRCLLVASRCSQSQLSSLRFHVLNLPNSRCREILQAGRRGQLPHLVRVIVANDFR
jgi:hypothetical protein